jgi:hypothetical protein
MIQIGSPTLHIRINLDDITPNATKPAPKLDDPTR